MNAILLTHILALAFVFTTFHKVTHAANETALDTDTRTVLVELFTSQGCSSCPPADEILSQLANYDHPEIAVIPLSFHVDYWNRPWEDPFSHPDWTNRQKGYCSRLSPKWIYTPQMVFNGSRECIGNDPAKVRRAIKDAAKTRPAARLEIEVEEPVVSSGQKGLEIQVSTEVLREDVPPTLNVVAVLFENGIVTHIPSGENANRTLKNDFVVRRLINAGAIPTTTGERHENEFAFPLEDSWNLDNLGIAAYVQRPDTFQILGASSIHLRNPVSID
ncbi:MAG: DUF1223 domain-containing protein [bacterium]